MGSLILFETRLPRIGTLQEVYSEEDAGDKDWLATLAYCVDPLLHFCGADGV